MPFDGIVLAHSNESEWQTFRNNKHNEAFLDRVYIVKVPYCLRVTEEIRIYRKLLTHSSLAGAPCAPDTLDMLAQFSVLSRIKEPENSSIYSKMKVYDGQSIKDTEAFNYVRAGFTSQGIPAKLDVVRSLRGAHARRLGLGGARKRKIRELERQLAELKTAPEDADPVFSKADQIQALEAEIARLKANVKRIPFIDDIDLRYRQHVKQPRPATSAVMFCLMDVSGSMTQAHKDIAKRFFILLYLFLKKNYKKIEVVFIRHHTSAKEVDEEEFFYSRETGGTIVSSALRLMHQIIEARYSPAEWNIYAAQASDGDNWNDDSPICGKLLANQLLPLVQYYAYVEITPNDHQQLWYQYEEVQEAFPEAFAMQQIADPADIYPVFRQLFERKAA